MEARLAHGASQCAKPLSVVDEALSRSGMMGKA